MQQGSRQLRRQTVLASLAVGLLVIGFGTTLHFGSRATALVGSTNSSHEARLIANVRPISDAQLAHDLRSELLAMAEHNVQLHQRLRELQMRFDEHVGAERPAWAVMHPPQAVLRDMLAAKVQANPNPQELPPPPPPPPPAAPVVVVPPKTGSKFRDMRADIAAARLTGAPYWPSGQRVDPGIYKKRGDADADAVRYHPRFPNGAPVPHPLKVQADNFTEQQHAVVAMMRHAWAGYKECAWGYDEVKPVSCSGKNWPGNGTLMLTIIDSLDTLWLCGMQSEFDEAVLALRGFNFTRLTDGVNIFELTIRVVGGLLSAYWLSAEPTLLDLANEVGERTVATFPRKGETVLPEVDVILADRRSQHADWLGITTSLSEVTSIQLEYKTLSYFTGNMDFDNAAMFTERVVLSHLDDVRVPGLFEMLLHMGDGSPIPGRLTLGARGDSFYEYVAKLVLLTRDDMPLLRDAWRRISKGIRESLTVKLEDKRIFVAEREDGRQSLKMDHLVCFVVVPFALQPMDDGDVEWARGVARTCADMYELAPTTRLAPEISLLDGAQKLALDLGSAHNLLRPEALEAMHVMAELEPDNPFWRERAWEMIAAFNRSSRVGTKGFASIDDVREAKGHRDDCPSYFFAETIKYALLALKRRGAEAEPRITTDDWVMNTEAHPLRKLPGDLRAMA